LGTAVPDPRCTDQFHADAESEQADLDRIFDLDGYRIDRVLHLQPVPQPSSTCSRRATRHAIAAF
jgi:hypothetical protein